MPPVIAAAIESSRRNRTPSRASRHTRDMSIRSRSAPRVERIAMPATMAAENMNVAASNTSARDSGCVAKTGTRALMPLAIP